MQRRRIRTSGRNTLTTPPSAHVPLTGDTSLTRCHRFIDSESDLDLALKSLLPLAQSPIIAYPELISSGAVSRLIGLLSHENADIVIDVVEVIHELTDEDVGNEGDEDEEDDEGKREDALKALIESLVGLYLLVLLEGCINFVCVPA